MEKVRDATIDILKGIGIILMVAGHCGAPFTSYIYLFHMAIFLFQRAIVLMKSMPYLQIV